MDKINKFIKIFTDKKIENIDKINREYFLVNEEQKKVNNKISKEPFSMGIYLGEYNKVFKASPALIDMIAKISDKKAIISKKAEWLFLCGRDVFEESIIKTNEEKGFVLVQNEKNENLGFGEFKKEKKLRFIKNIQDKGFYLRREN